MKSTVCIAIAALLLGIAPIAYVGMGQTMQPGKAENPQEIERLLLKFEEARAKTPFRYPTACVAGTAETYTLMALRAGLRRADGVQLSLWTVPEQFGRVDHPEPNRKSGRCDYRVSLEGESESAHFIADFFSREHSRTGEIAYVKVWQQGSQDAVLVTFPNGPRGLNPQITFKAVPVGTRPGANP